MAAAKHLYLVFRFMTITYVSCRVEFCSETAVKILFESFLYANNKTYGYIGNHCSVSSI
jgi:hypothetical protein